MAVSTVGPKPDLPKPDRFSVGDLVYASKRSLVYMLVPRDNTLPARAGKGTLSGVCVWSKGGRDADGDTLPPVGYFHNNLGEGHLEFFPYTLTIHNERRP